jgi:lysophospholipase L1-like esterase
MVFCPYAMGADVEFKIIYPCLADFGPEPDGDVDGSDFAVLVSDYGNPDCNIGGCRGDMDGDGGVDEADLIIFVGEFGRDDCDQALPPAPLNQFAIGDSIGEGEAADNAIGEMHHETVWSTGYDASDSVAALNERFEAADPAGYYENNSVRDPIFNVAVSGSEMADFVAQANQVIAGAQNTPTGQAGLVTILLGNNDVCAPSLGGMTDPGLFETQYRGGLEVLAGSDATRNAFIHVTGIPAIYWLWNAKRGSLWCRAIAWPFVPCENLLANPADDCVSAASRLDPDTIYAGDGDNCIRRKQFHQKIRDIYNPILRDVLEEYAENGRLPNAYFVDIFDIRFESVHVNGGDCFHPSAEGHALLAEENWYRSPWSFYDLFFEP